MAKTLSMQSAAELAEKFGLQAVLVDLDGFPTPAVIGKANAMKAQEHGSRVCFIELHKGKAVTIPPDDRR